MPIGNGRHAAAGAILGIGLLAMAHGAILARIADAHPIVIAAARVGLAGLVLLPMALAAHPGEIRRLDRRGWTLIAAAGVFLAVHFATWIAALGLTSIANSAVLVSLAPVWIALFAAVARRRAPAVRTLVSIAAALGGAAIIAYGSATAGGGSLIGDGLALVGGLAMALYLLSGRAVAGRLSLLTYLALCYGVAGAVLAVAALAAGLPVTGLGTTTYLAMIALALVSQIVGHGSINWAVRRFEPGFVALCLLGEPLLTALLAALYFGEGVGPATMGGGGLVLAGIYLAMRASPPDPPGARGMKTGR
ncbi:MAG: DMT family transporter [Inquilinaceae bacterium]